MYSELRIGIQDQSMLRNLNQYIVYDPMGQKSNVDIVILQYDISILQFDLFVPTLLQTIIPIESKVDFLLCSKSIVFIILMFAILHLFDDFFLSTLVTTFLM